jgi:hypothetical protein
MDIDNIQPTPDLETLDLAAMDRGDSIVPVEEPKTEPVEEPVEPTEEPTEPSEELEPEEPEEEQPRDEKGKFTGKGIPKARFDEAVGKERDAREAAERRAAELERQLAQASRQQEQSTAVAELEASIEALESKHAELLLDGDTAGAAKVMKDIRMSERQIARAESEAMVTQRTSQALESQRVNASIARLEADYAPLNPDSEVYDADLVELVLTKQRTLIQQQGYSPSDALTEAANTVMKRFGTAPQEPADEKGLAAAKQTADRKAEQVKKNLATAAKQPGSLKDSGMDSDKAGQTGTLPNVSQMTEEEFKALPESTKAKLRGDFV